jgi:uncharacterized phage-associated protein
MPFDARAIANFFVSTALAKGDQITPLKLQKLVYFAQGWHLALADRPLIDEQVEAWRYGPVIPSVYRAFRDYGDNPIVGPTSYLITKSSGPGAKVVSIEDLEFEEIIPTIDDYPEAAKIRPLLDRVWDIYGGYSAIQLSNITHQSGTPWDQVNREYNGEIPKGTDIPAQKMKDYFSSLKAKRSSGS